MEPPRPGDEPRRGGLWGGEFLMERWAIHRATRLALCYEHSQAIL